MSCIYQETMFVKLTSRLTMGPTEHMSKSLRHYAALAVADPGRAVVCVIKLDLQMCIYFF